MSRPLRRVLFGMVLFVFTATVILAMAEGAARLLVGDLPGYVLRFGVHHSPEVAFDPYLGWKAAPGLDAELQHGLHRVHVRTNSDGFRDGEWDDKLERAQRTRAEKVLLIGDSNLYGWGIMADERLSDQLEEAAARAGRPLVAFNFGIPGFGTGQELLVLERWISRIEPDVVVLQFSPNDVANISLPYAYYSPDRRVYRPFFDDHGEPMLHEGGRRRPSLWLAEGPLAGLRLRWLLDLASNRLDDLNYALRGIAENRVVTDPATGKRYDLGHMSFSPYHKDLLRESFPKLEALLARIARVCRDHGARLIVVTPFMDRKDTEGQRLAKILEFGADVRLAMPPELLRYDGWSRSLSDGHHNYLANLHLARDLLAEVMGVTQEADARRAGWFDRVPSTLDFSGPQVSRYVYGDVKRDQATRSWVARGPSTRILLRAPGSAPHYRLSLSGRWLGGEGSGGGGVPGDLTLRTADVVLMEEFPSSGDFALSVDLSEELLMDGLLLLELGFEAAVDRGLELHRAQLQPLPGPVLPRDP